MSAQVYSALDQSEGRRKVFLGWTSINLISKLFFAYGGNITGYKSVHHPLPIPLPVGNRKHPGNFQKKSVNSPLNWVSRYILFLAKLKGRVRPISEVQEGGHIVRLPSRELAYHKRWKNLAFCEIWNNLSPPLIFIRPPYK